MRDFLFRGSLSELDPQVEQLAQFEAERQYRRLILIPSESTVPQAVREALSTAFHNIYAEGYPPEDTRWMNEAAILDYEARLSDYRRHSDPRYYKGTEYANLIEALARRRCAETFAANGLTADDLFVNVQALSGGPANNAIYHALVEPGDTIMGMDLLHGGHLSHGSPVNRSGKFFKSIHYKVDPETERLDYEAVAELAGNHQPKFIIAGYSSYPWAVDWAKFRHIADSVGAYLFADIAHVAGLVAAGVYPSPVGYADVISFTTHKTLCGPRGACILTADPILAKKIDRAVFPGEQGGPHINVFAALAVAFNLARTEKFRELQHQIVNNCAAMSDRLEARGFRIPFGGTNTHLMNLDCKSIIGEDGTPLSGDQAARVLDLAGIVLNRNTIPGDKSALNPSGLRLGTPWITQRGFKEAESQQVADIIADLLHAVKPYNLGSSQRPVQRAKVRFEDLHEASRRVRELSEAAGIDYEVSGSGYPQTFYADRAIEGENGRVELAIHGDKVRQFLNFALSSDVEALAHGHHQITSLYASDTHVEGKLTAVSSDRFNLEIPAEHASLAAAWLRSLSDGFVQFDSDLFRKVPGPVQIQVTSDHAGETSQEAAAGQETAKPYFVGIGKGSERALPEFAWKEAETEEIKRTPLNPLHRDLGAKLIPFAGWEMPVWYTGVMDEHQAVRQAAGLFDVTHMGVYQAEGPDAAVFLDSVCGNDVSSLGVGNSLYTHFLDPDANVIDDLLVYRRAPEKYLIVVNAANDDKNWAWLEGVRRGEVLVDRVRPWSRAYGRGVTLRNMRDKAAGDAQLADIALQGPSAREILLELGADMENTRKVARLKRTQLCEAVIGGYTMIISRTGYTGERMAFELFVHPDQAAGLFQDLLNVGEPHGLKPCGLGARDSLRTEAGLPLYGHEMGGSLNLGVGDAGFGSYVKIYKPWFIGRQVFIEKERARTSEVVRFSFNERGVRMAHLGDPVLDKRGRTIGVVTSCAIDSEGTLTGQAYLDSKQAAVGSELYIYQNAPSLKMTPPADLRPGQRTAVPSIATVLRRFPRP